MKAENQRIRTMGLALLLGWIGVIFYSSYRLEKGLTEIGTGLIAFLERMADSWSATAGWDLSWLQGALEEIVHIEAFILLGVFLALVMSWWDIRGRRMRYAMAAVAILTGLADEGFQEVFLSGAFRMLDVLWDLLAVLAGAGIFHFIRATNREEE